MIKIGLTGGFGSGKSLVADIFRQQDIPIIDADRIAHELVNPGSPQFQQIVDTFGPDLIAADGHIKRNQLAEIVFKDTSMRQRLNDILHPAVMHVIETKLSDYQSNGIECVIVDVPLLYETKMETIMDQVIVVWAPEPVCIERLTRFRGFTDQNARQRIDSQLNIDDKKRRADYVIDNSGSIPETREQAATILAAITSRN